MFVERKMIKALRWLFSLHEAEDFLYYDEEEMEEDGGLCLSEVCRALRENAETVYQYSVKGKDEISFSYRGKELFEMRGCFITAVTEMYVSDDDVVSSAYNTELWLLEDMSFALVRCVRMTFGSEHCEYRTSYRSIIKRVSGRKDLICPAEELFEALAEMCVPQWEGIATIYEI